MNSIGLNSVIGVLSLVLFVYMALDSIRLYRPCLTALRKKLRTEDDVGSENVEPRVQVLLCLRGKDPFLDRCLRNLAHQAYASYRVTVIIDTEEDPVYAQVQELLRSCDSQRFEIIVRDCFYSTCSRRACSLISGLNQVSDEVDVVVMCDGDTVVHHSWLQELMAAFDDPSVMATSGNRWYVPSTPNLGSLCRYFWNAMAVPTMFDHGIPWAGSMAISRSIFTEPEYLKRLQQAFSEDTQLAEYLSLREVQVKPMPDLPIINEETVSISTFWGFLIRQLIATRLHHPKWSQVLGNAIITGLNIWILLPLSVFAGSVALTCWFAGYTIYGVVAQSLIGSYEFKVRCLVRTKRGISLPPFGLRRILLSFPAGTLTMFLYSIAAIRAATVKTHVWRGIPYQIGNREIRAIDTESDEIQTIEDYTVVT